MRLLLFTLLLPLFSVSQQTTFSTDASGNIAFEEVVTIDSSLRAEQLYKNTLNWFLQNFKSPKDALELQVPATYTIVGKGTTPVKWHNPYGGIVNGNMAFRINVACKDGKYKYVISDLLYLDNSFRPLIGVIELVQKKKNINAEKSRLLLLEAVNNVISSLKTAMTKSDNW